MKQRTECPLCYATILNINRHLKGVHMLHSQSEFNSVKRKIFRKTLLLKNLYYRRPKKCLYSSCGGKYFFRLDRHYINRHGHKARDPTHLEYLRRSSKLIKIQNKPDSIVQHLFQRDQKVSDRVTTTTVREEEAMEQKRNSQADDATPSASFHAGPSTSRNLGTDDDATCENIRDRTSEPGICLLEKIESFRSWLISADGESKQPKNATEYSNRVRNILQRTACASTKYFASPNNYPERNLDPRLIRELWFDKLDCAPSTKKSYLFSLKLFLRYMRDLQHNGGTQVLSKSDLTYFADKCNTWAKSLRRESFVWRNQRMRKESLDMITSEMVTKYYASEYVARCREKLQKMLEMKYRKSKSLKKVLREYRQLRNYLILEIFLCNGNRTGDLANFTVNDFVRTQRVEIVDSEPNNGDPAASDSEDEGKLVIDESFPEKKKRKKILSRSNYSTNKDDNHDDVRTKEDRSIENGLPKDNKFEKCMDEDDRINVKPGLPYQEQSMVETSDEKTSLLITDHDEGKKEDNTFFVFAINEHKTAEKYGPAKIYLSSELFNQMLAFYKTYLRTSYDKNNHFFVHYEKTMTMKSAGICKAMQSAWKEGRMTENISAVKIRKSLVTLFHNSKTDDMKNMLSSHMRHLPQTARLYYKYQEGVTEAVKVGREIQKVFQNRDKFNYVMQKVPKDWFRFDGIPTEITSNSVVIKI